MTNRLHTFHCVALLLAGLVATNCCSLFGCPVSASNVPSKTTLKGTGQPTSKMFYEKMEALNQYLNKSLKDFIEKKSRRCDVYSKLLDKLTSEIIPYEKILTDEKMIIQMNELIETYVELMFCYGFEQCRSPYYRASQMNYDLLNYDLSQN